MARLLRWLGSLRPRWSIGSRGGTESTGRLARWLPIGAAIGVVAGGGAILFTRAIELVTHLALALATGFQPPGPAGEGAATYAPAVRPWLLPLVTALGGLASGLIVFGLAPEAEGHGTDAAIEAFHRRGGWIRARIPPVKLLASAITIGTGGSAGREGPAAQISAGFGALLGRAVLRRPGDRRIAVAVGIGAGIGAIFRAPLGGALLAAEILYVHDMEVEAILPSLIASIVGYTLYGAVVGFTPIFGAHPALELGSPVQLLYYTVLGAAAGGGGLLYARSFYGVTAAFARVPLPRWLKAGLGGLGVGALGLVFPQVLHTGYGWVQAVMTRGSIAAFPVALLVVFPFAKILATSLSIGTGGSGGIFGPGMVVGAMLGAALWRLGTALALPGMPGEPAAFVIVGMMSLFGGIAHAPLAVMLMVAEMTGTLSLLAPAMIAVAVSTAVVGDETIYRAQLLDRASSPFHRARFGTPLLASVALAEATERLELALPEETAVSEALARMAAAGVQVAAVLDAAARPVGSISRTSLARVPAAEHGSPLSAVTVRLSLRGGQTLEDGMRTLAEAGTDTAPVMEDGAATGVVTARGILRAYRAAAARRRPGTRLSAEG
ncbi:MAG TPA: chloride channel protein [Anaeromyxobacter sp.]|nr:chloride channel protein [Anaeromyxobacter sp.]